MRQTRSHPTDKLSPEAEAMRRQAMTERADMLERHAVECREAAAVEQCSGMKRWRGSIKRAKKLEAEARWLRCAVDPDSLKLYDGSGKSNT